MDPDLCGGVSTFWITHPNNIITNNVAAGSVNKGTLLHYTANHIYSNLLYSLLFSFHIRNMVHLPSPSYWSFRTLGWCRFPSIHTYGSSLWKPRPQVHNHLRYQIRNIYFFPPPPSISYSRYYSTPACFRLDDGIIYDPNNPLMDGGITSSRYKPHLGANLTAVRYDLLLCWGFLLFY